MTTEKFNYYPELLPSSPDRESLANYIFQELEKISFALNTTNVNEPIHYDLKPAKPAEGETIYFDSSAPSGKGLYIWDGTAWKKTDSGDEITQIQTDITQIQTDITQVQTDLNKKPNENWILNAGINIAQRGHGGPYLLLDPEGYVGPDRWRLFRASTLGNIGRVISDADGSSVSDHGGGKIYMGSTSLHSLDNSHYYWASQIIESYKIASLKWGTSDAKPITISFNARGYITGKYGLTIRNHNGTRLYVTSFTLTQNIKERIEITIPGDTGGSWLLSGIEAGLEIAFNTSTGSNFTNSTENAWVTGTTTSWGTPGTVNLGSVVGAFFEFSDVKLEEGDTATKYEARDITEDLLLCERYFEKGIDQNDGTWFQAYVSQTGTNYNATVRFHTKKRDIPTITLTNITNSNFGSSTGEVFVTVRGFRERRLTTGVGKAFFGSTFWADAEIYI